MKMCAFDERLSDNVNTLRHKELCIAENNARTSALLIVLSSLQCVLIALAAFSTILLVGREFQLSAVVFDHV